MINILVSPTWTTCSQPVTHDTYLCPLRTMTVTLLVSSEFSGTLTRSFQLHNSIVFQNWTPWTAPLVRLVYWVTSDLVGTVSLRCRLKALGENKSFFTSVLIGRWCNSRWFWALTSEEILHNDLWTSVFRHPRRVYVKTDPVFMESKMVLFFHLKKLN